MKKKENVPAQVQEGTIPDENLELENNAEGEDQESGEILKVFTALYPILYLSHQYKVGDVLPANDPDMVEAWIRAGTAAWIQPVEESPKAKSRTAEPGFPGQAVSSEAEDGDDLAGKIPKTFGRKR